MAPPAVGRKPGRGRSGWGRRPNRRRSPRCSRHRQSGSGYPAGVHVGGAERDPEICRRRPRPASKNRPECAPHHKSNGLGQGPGNARCARPTPLPPRRGLTLASCTVSARSSILPDADRNAADDSVGGYREPVAGGLESLAHTGGPDGRRGVDVVGGAYVAGIHPRGIARGTSRRIPRYCESVRSAAPADVGDMLKSRPRAKSRARRIAGILVLWELDAKVLMRLIATTYPGGAVEVVGGSVIFMVTVPESLL